MTKFSSAVSEPLRQRFLSAYSAGLSRVDGRRLVRAAMRAYREKGPFSVLALGKAGASMMAGALDSAADQIMQGLVVATEGESSTVQHPRIRHLRGGHPLPNEHSLHAGAAVWDFIDRLPDRQPLVVLLSGGTSALLEHPVPGLSLAQLQAVNRCLLGGGWSIEQINAVRARLSRIKGGGLAQQSRGRPVTVWVLSDVANDRLSAVGSGPFWGPSGCAIPADLPDWLKAQLKDRAVPELRLRPAHYRLAGNQQALSAMRRYWRREAPMLPVRVHPEALSGPVEAVAQRLNQNLQDEAGVIHLWGGESTVVLPSEPGNGGRAQHLALLAASAWDTQQPQRLLVASTDGRDGGSDAAGAVISSDDVTEARRQGLNLEQAIHTASSGSPLETLGCLIDTGTTGTNVRDIAIGFRETCPV